jgi:nitrogenase molybdenum-cofactor synthesis protein NifE
MGLFKYFPIPSQRLGMLWSLMGIKDAVIIDYGPEGTLSYFYDSLVNLDAKMDSRMYTVALREREVVFGDSGRLLPAIKRLDERHAPQYIFISPAPVAEIIGADLKAACQEYQPQVKAKLIVLPSCGFKDDWTQGIAFMLKLLAAILPVDCKPQANCFNIIGSCNDDFNFQADTHEIIRILSAGFGCKPVAVLTSQSSIENLSLMGQAQFNLVLRREGIAAAELLKRRFGIPYLVGKPYGLSAVSKWLDDIVNLSGLSYSQAVTEELRVAEMAVKRACTVLHRGRCRQVLLGAHSDTALGLQQFFRDDLDLAVQSWCYSPLMHCPEIPYWNETEREDALLSSGADYILADGVSLSLLPADAPALQIANPNLVNRELHQMVPFAGIRGIHTLLAFLMQNKTD